MDGWAGPGGLLVVSHPYSSPPATGISRAERANVGECTRQLAGACGDGGEGVGACSGQLAGACGDQ